MPATTASKKGLLKHIPNKKIEAMVRLTLNQGRWCDDFACEFSTTKRETAIIAEAVLGKVCKLTLDRAKAIGKKIEDMTTRQGGWKDYEAEQEEQRTYEEAIRIARGELDNEPFAATIEELQRNVQSARRAKAKLAAVNQVHNRELAALIRASEKRYCPYAQIRVPAAQTNACH
jgi:hypothetical protein